MPSEIPHTPDLPPTLVLDHLMVRSFDETIRPSAYVSPRDTSESIRVQALPQILDVGPASEADFSRLEPIGMGGMGVVDLGRQRSVGRDVVIKRVRDPSIPGAAAMLMDEGYVMGLLEHPSIVPVLTVGRDGDGQPALVMKRVDGVTWQTLLRDPHHAAWEPIAGDRLEFNLRVLAQVADAAHHAHQQGWLHRDIKPDNVMIGPRAEVYLIDWGLAVQVPVDPLEEEAQIVGTLGYIAPEMLRGKGPWLSPQTDVYLLGATLHELLAGKARHEGANLRALLASAWMSEAWEYPASTPAELASLANAATQVLPEDRPPSAEAFKQRIEACLRHRQALVVVEEVRVLSEGLRAIAPDEVVEDEVEVLQRFDGCVVGLRRSLELWPQNDPAVGLLSEVLAWRARRALAQGDVFAAQAALADMPRVDAGLEAEVSEASSRISQERISRTRLNDIGRMHDLRPLATLRARAARESALLGGGAMIALGAAVHLGVVPFTWSILAAAASAAAVIAVLAARGRGRDDGTGGARPREMAWVVGGALALTILGRFIGLTPGQTLAILPVFAGVGAGLLADGMGSARGRLVAVCAFSAAAAPAVLRYDPSFLLDLMGLMTVASHLVLARSWEHLADDAARSS